MENITHSVQEIKKLHTHYRYKYNTRVATFMCRFIINYIHTKPTNDVSSYSLSLWLINLVSSLDAILGEGNEHHTL